MSTSEGTAPGGAFPGDAFGLDPADDGEEVYEWVAEEPDDQAGDGGGRPRPPRRPLRQTVGESLSLLRGRWRAVRRRALVSLAVTALAGSAAVGATAWFDTVARGADDAGVASLALDAVVDGDPAVARFDTESTRGTLQYVLELANNGPTAVTVTGVSIDAGTLMTSTGWQPVDSARIPAGETGRAALTVQVDCGLLLLAPSFAAGSPSGPTFAFPDVHVSVRTGNGDTRQVTLTSHQRILPDISPALRGLTQAVGEPPQVTMADTGRCLDLLQQRAVAAESDQAITQPGFTQRNRSADQITVVYTGVKKTASQGAPEYVLGFRAHNPGTVTMMSLADPGDTGFANSELVTMTPQQSTIPPGGDADFTLTVKPASCHDDLGGDDATQFFVSTGPKDRAGDADIGVQFGPLGHFLTGSGIQLALDELAQRKAACPW